MILQGKRSLIINIHALFYSLLVHLLKKPTLYFMLVPEIFSKVANTYILTFPD